MGILPNGTLKRNLESQPGHSPEWLQRATSAYEVNRADAARLEAKRQRDLARAAQDRAKERQRLLENNLARLCNLDPARLPIAELITDPQNPDSIIPLITVDGVTFGPGSDRTAVRLYRVCPTCGRWLRSEDVDSLAGIGREVTNFTPVGRHNHPPKRSPWRGLRQLVGRIVDHLTGW